MAVDALKMSLTLLDEFRPVLEGIEKRLGQMESTSARRDKEQIQRVVQVKKSYEDLSKSVTRLGAGFSQMGQQAVQQIQGVVNWTLRWAVVAKGAATAGMTLILRQGIKLNEEMEKYRNTLKTVLRSQEQANAMIAWIIRFAETTPFEVQGLVEASVQLESVGLNAKKWLPIIGDLAAGFGGTSESIFELIRAFSLLRAGSSGLAMLTFRRFAITREDLERKGLKFSKTGELQSDPDKALEAVRQIVENKFGGLMQTLSKTYTGVMSNIKDMATNVLRETVAPLFVSVSGAVNDFLDVLNDLRESGDMSRWAEDIGGTLKGVFDAAYESVKKFAEKARTEGIGPALKALWEEDVWPHAQKFIDRFTQLLFDSVSRAFKAAFSAIDFGKLASEHPILTGLAANWLTGGLLAKGAAGGLGKLGRGAGGLLGRGAGAIGIGGIAKAGLAGLGTVGVTSVAGAAGLAFGMGEFMHRRNLAKERELERGLGPTEYVQQFHARRAAIAQEELRTRSKLDKALSGVGDEFIALHQKIKTFGTSVQEIQKTFAESMRGARQSFLGLIGLTPREKRDALTREITTRTAALGDVHGDIGSLVGKLTAPYRTRRDAAGRIVSGIGDDVSSLQDAGESALKAQVKLASELVALYGQQIAAEFKLHEAQVKTNKELVKRLGLLEPRKQLDQFRAIEQALKIAGSGSAEKQIRELTALSREQLQSIMGVGIVNNDLIVKALQRQLVTRAEAFGFGDAAAFLRNKPIEVQREQYIERFDSVVQHFTGGFNQSIDALTGAFETFESTLADRFRDAAASVVQALHQQKLDIRFANGIGLDVDFMKQSREDFATLVKTSVQQAIAQATIHITSEGAELDLGVGSGG